MTAPPTHALPMRAATGDVMEDKTGDKGKESGS
jgi:hypothetical protein